MSDWYSDWHGTAKIPSSYISGLSQGGGSTLMSTGITNALSTKASLGHTHPQADVTNLTSTLSAISLSVSTKAAGSHTHVSGDVTGLDSSLAGLALSLSTKAAGTHSHVTGDVTGLDSSLAGLAASISTKAAGAHTHVTADVTGLDSSLAGLASALSTKASLNAGLVPGAQLGSGSTAGSVFLKGDGTWATPPAAPSSWTTTTFDCGYIMARMTSFVVSDLNVQSTTRRILFQFDSEGDTAVNTPDSDPISVRCVPGTNQFTAFVWGVDSPIGGVIAASYQVQ